MHKTSQKDLNDALDRAVYYEGNLQKVKELIAAGANVHMEADHQERGSLLNRCKDAAIVRELLLNGVSVDRTNNFRETPLLVASTSDGGNSDVVRELLKAGAWVNARDRKGNTPLNKAVKSSDLETIKILLDYGADINICNRERRMSEHNHSPLDNAMGSLPVAKLLIKMFLIKNFDENRQKINLEPYSEWRNYGQLVQYFDGCISEIVQMKTDIVYQQISLYDLMTKSAINLSGNNKWVKKIKDEMTERYPIYHDVIADKIEFCLVRWNLLNKLRDLKFFTVLEASEGKRRIALDPDSLHTIANYLSTEDLLNLVSALSNSYINNFASNSEKLSNSDEDSKLIPDSDTSCSEEAPSCSIKRAKLD